MQPPPRKVKVTQEVKNCHSEQMNRLTIKHQTECDLLEDMRTYSLKKGQLERDYAQALQKLSSQYLKRDWPGISPDDQRTDYRNVYAVWRSYLEGTVQVSQSRLNVCENYKNQISDPAKTLRLYKEQQLKKTIDQLSVIQSELQDSVKELAKTKKRYAESEQLAQAVREREKSKLGLFQSRISLQKASVKLKAKRSDCNSKATQARNDYVLTLAAANAHHDRYYHTDLLTCIQALDGGVFDHVKDYLVSLCRTELETFQTTHSTFTFLLDKSSKVVQEFNQQLFMSENPVFKKTSDFLFLPSDNDLTLGSMQKLVDIEPSPISTMRLTLAQSRQMESDSSTTEEHSLNKEARKWATRLAREHKNILLHKRSLEECEGLGSAHLGSGQSEQSRADLEMKSDDTKEHIRRAETVKLKAEARLDLLRQVGVAVDTWLKSAMNQVMEELENERWANCTSHDPSLSEECEDNMEVFDDSSSSPSEVTLRSYPLTCKVIYCYKASQPDELTIDEGQMLEVIEDGDMEDWVKARSQSGKVGYVPEKYLQFPASSSSSVLSMLSSLAAPDTLSMLSTPDALSMLSTPDALSMLSTPDALSMLSTPDALSMLSAPDARSHASSNSTELETPNGEVHAVHVRALYSYTAQTGEELSFSEGSVIRLLSRDTSDGQTDDGFWLGELGGRVGVFPSVLVEEVSENNSAPAGQEESLQFQKSALLPLPLYDQPPSPMMPFTSPEPLPRSPSTNQNGEHKPLPPPAPSHNKGPPVTHSRSPVSPGLAPPLRFTPDGGPAPGKLRPVRAAPPPPKQPPRRAAEKTNEEVEITLV